MIAVKSSDNVCFLGFLSYVFRMFLYLDHLVGLARHLAGVARHLAGVAPYPLVFLRDTGVMNCFYILLFIILSFSVQVF